MRYAIWPSRRSSRVYTSESLISRSFSRESMRIMPRWLSGARGVRLRVRAVPDYEHEGRRFYALAAREAEPPWPASVFEYLAEKFTLARETLNILNDYYLRPLRARYFDQPSG